MDFAARIRVRLRALRRRIEARDTLVEVVRGAHASVEPRGVAAWLVRQAQAWVPADCWAVVAHDSDGQVVVLADAGLTSGLGPGLWVAAHWVLQHGADFASADLSADRRGTVGASGTALGIPLVSRRRLAGVLVGLDAAPSSVPPAVDPALRASLEALLEPSAIALDNAITVQRAEALSVTDDLTRLYNQRYLNLVLRREAKRAARHGRPLSLLFLDLDGFKQVNDRYGHLAGSTALVEVAAVIRGCARETDVVARFGGDEFSLILPDTGRDGAASVAARIRDRLRARRFLAADGLSVQLTASIGVATLPDVAASAEELLRVADAAMYTVKAAGKDGIHIAST